MKRIACLVLLVAFAFTSIVNAAEPIKIPFRVRVPNMGPGYCFWTSAETCCRYQMVKAGFGLAADRMTDPDTKSRFNPRLHVPRNAGTEDTVKNKFDGLGIKYRTTACYHLIQDDDNEVVKMIKEGEKQACIEAGKKLIREALAEGKPVIACMWTGLPTTRGPHAIIITSFSEAKDNYTYVDTNRIFSKTDFHASIHDWFDDVFTGWALVIDGDSND